VLLNVAAWQDLSTHIELGVINDAFKEIWRIYRQNGTSSYLPSLLVASLSLLDLHSVFVIMRN